MAPIAVLDKIPDGDLAYIDECGALRKVDIYKLGFKKKIVIFCLPGAFTPICSLEHVPGYLAKGHLLHEKGVDAIICLSVNDPFVMREWAKTYSSSNRDMTTNKSIVRFLADGSGFYTKALGMEHDLNRQQMGIRSRRYSLLVDDLVVKVANVEQVEGVFEVSTAEQMLNALKSFSKS
ncbi:unnamed protein product [Calypogeia fissa]